jgi:acyl carrier protein
MSDATLKRVCACVISTFRLPSDTPITRETTSADVDGWDSLSHAMLIMKVEQEFAVELPFDRVYDLANVGELADLVQATLEADTPAL